MSRKVVWLSAILASGQPGLNEVKNNSNYEEISQRLDALFDGDDPPTVDQQKLGQVQGKSSGMSSGAKAGAKTTGRLGPSSSDLATQKFSSDVLGQMARIARDPLHGKSWADVHGGRKRRFSWEAVFGAGFLGRKEGLPESIPNYLERCPLHSFTTGSLCVMHSNGPVDSFQDASTTAAFFVTKQDSCEGGAAFQADIAPSMRVALHQFCGWSWPSTEVCAELPLGVPPMCPFGFVRETTNPDFCEASLRFLDMPPDCTPPLPLRPSRQELEACSTGFPCHVPRTSLYDQPCPKGWQLVRVGVCQAPRDYPGPCPSYQRVVAKRWRPHVATVCIVSWD